jgi:hypothetical protein
MGQNLVSLYHHCHALSRSSPSLATPVDLRVLCEGTSSQPLLPSLVPPAPPTSSEEASGEEEGGRREGKRRFPDLPQPPLPKRRSSRVKSRREQVSASERFAHFLPDNLRGCEFGDVCALSPLPASEDGPPLPSLVNQSDNSALDHAPRLSDEVVKLYLQEHEENSGAVSLIYSYLLLLARHYNWQWSEASWPVVKGYLELFDLVQPHLQLPSPLCCPGDAEYTSLQDMAMVLSPSLQLVMDLPPSDMPLLL